MSKRSRKKRAKEYRDRFMDESTVADVLRARKRARANETPRQKWVREEREKRLNAARERIRNMKMPSHPAPLTEEEWFRKNWR